MILRNLLDSLRAFLGRRAGSCESFLQAGLQAELSGNHTVAERHFRRAVNRDPLSSVATQELGRFLAGQHRLDEAIGLLERAVSLGAQGTGARLHLANAMRLRGDE